MDYLEIQGEAKLNGSVKISGAKNAALPLLALCILSKNEVQIYNLPNVADINTFSNLLRMLGAKIESSDLDSKTLLGSKDQKRLDSKNTKRINTQEINSTKALYDIVRKMRASILVLGPLLARFGKCEVSLPGGCAIGARPVDLHIKAMRKLGASVEVKGGYILAEAKKGLKGCDIVFDKISVTGTSNAVMAAALAKGKSRIINAAKEPEVVQVCETLRNAGLDITGIGSQEIAITGSHGELLDFKPINVIPDRIEAGTYLCAGAITNSQITIENVIEEHIESILVKLREIGFRCGVARLDSKAKKSLLQTVKWQNSALQPHTWQTTAESKLCSIEIFPAKKLNPFRIITTEYPGFPTDMQAQFMALSTQCSGASLIKETLFENRFMHVNELQRLGADITIDGNAAQIKGKSELIAADVMATDLRASSALILAALVARGTTKIHRIYHLDRGYENIEKKLSELGARVRRGRE